MNDFVCKTQSHQIFPFVLLGWQSKIFLIFENFWWYFALVMFNLFSYTCVLRHSWSESRIGHSAPSSSVHSHRHVTGCLSALFKLAQRGFSPCNCRSATDSLSFLFFWHSIHFFDTSHPSLFPSRWSKGNPRINYDTQSRLNLQIRNDR